MAVYRVELVNGQKALVPVSGSAAQNTVQAGSLNPVSGGAVASAIGDWETVWTDPNNSDNIIYGIKNKLGTWVRIRFSGAVNNFGGGNYINNGTIILTLPEGWRPILKSPNRCTIGVDTPQYRCNAGLDIASNGNVAIYFQGNTPLGGGEYVTGLFCDVFMNFH